MDHDPYLTFSSFGKEMQQFRLVSSKHFSTYKIILCTETPAKWLPLISFRSQQPTKTNNNKKPKYKRRKNDAVTPWLCSHQCCLLCSSLVSPVPTARTPDWAHCQSHRWWQHCPAPAAVGHPVRHCSVPGTPSAASPQNSGPRRKRNPGPRWPGETLRSHPDWLHSPLPVEERKRD